MIHAFSGTSGAAPSRKHASSFLSALQSIRLVSFAPTGADSIAAPPTIAAASTLTQPLAEKLYVDTAAVESTAMRDVPVTTRCGMFTADAIAGTMRTPPPTPTTEPNIPARTPSGAAIFTAFALSAGDEGSPAWIRRADDARSDDDALEPRDGGGRLGGR
jgi:hypothetical protein